MTLAVVKFLFMGSEQIPKLSGLCFNRTRIDLKRRLFFNKLLIEKAFDRLVVLNKSLGKITVEQVYDGNEKPLLNEVLLLKG